MLQLIVYLYSFRSLSLFTGLGKISNSDSVLFNNVIVILTGDYQANNIDCSVIFVTTNILYPIDTPSFYRLRFLDLLFTIKI
jgi:hypothetical protein